jgi:hypothetical protein
MSDTTHFDIEVSRVIDAPRPRVSATVTDGTSEERARGRRGGRG